MTVWQIAAGDGNRDYHEVFVRFGLACVGPGDPGDYFEHHDAYDQRSHWSYRPFMRPFCEQLAEGDVLILKRPAGRRWAVLAVGEVCSDYHYEPRLDDVEGWDLQHTRAVAWRAARDPVIVDGLSRGTLSRVGKGELRELAQSLLKELPAAGSEELPEASVEVTDDDLIERLVDRGLPTSRAEGIVSTIWRVRRLASWYQRSGASIGEHEIRTFLIVPLLLALGWAEQRIKIEFSQLDLALFSGPYEDGAQPTLVIESKRLYDGLGGSALRQAQVYAMRYAECDRLIVSDGLRYKLLRREDEWWSPEAYANLLKLRARHPYDESVAGADALFLNLLP